MTEKIPREHASVRLDRTELARIEELATVEAEGNRSQMLRRLVTEALATRRNAAGRDSEPTFRAAARMVDGDLVELVGTSVAHNTDLDACDRTHRVAAREIAEDVLGHLLNHEWTPGQVRT